MTPLSKFLRSASPNERERCAQLAGTTVGYLYQLAGCHRGTRGIGASLALNIEDATRRLSFESGGVLPVVTAHELATMCVVADFADVPPPAANNTTGGVGDVPPGG